MTSPQPLLSLHSILALGYKTSAKSEPHKTQIFLVNAPNQMDSRITKVGVTIAYVVFQATSYDETLSTKLLQIQVSEALSIRLEEREICGENSLLP